MIPLLFVSLFAAAPARAADAAAALTPQMERLRDAAMASDYGWKRLAHLSHNIGPRLSGGPQAAAAVAYVAAELRALGADVTLQKAMVPHWVRGVETAELTAYPGQAPGTVQKIALTALGGSVATPDAGLEAPVVAVRSFEQLRALGRKKVEGRIVVFDYPFDERMALAGRAGEAYHESVRFRARGAQEAARLGAVAALNRSAGGADFRLPHTGGVDYSTEVVKIPAAALAAEDAELIADLAAQGEVRMRLTLTPKTLPEIESADVVADIKGTEHPEQIVLVSGHLDSWDLGTGSIDDGAGVVEAMETIHLIQKLGLKPKRTIRAVAWMNEENGAKGAQAYAAAHASDAQDHVLVFESDNGAGHALGIKAHLKPEAIERLRPALAILSAIGADIAQPVDEGVETDIEAMEKLGVPGAGLYCDTRKYFDYHHTAADTLDKVDPKELREGAAVMAVTAWAAANLPEPLPR